MDESGRERGWVSERVGGGRREGWVGGCVGESGDGWVGESGRVRGRRMGRWEEDGWVGEIGRVG